MPHVKRDPNIGHTGDSKDPKEDAANLDLPDKTPRDEAIDSAEQQITEGIGEAIAAIEAGQAAAAQAAIEAAKKSAKAILEATQMGIEAQERFFAIADKKLSPLIAQGTEASRELASMLGIPNDEGEIVPYNLDKLRKTPGYQFVVSESIDNILQSAIGNKLSTTTTDRIQERAAGLASQRFDKRLGNLQKVSDRGLQAGAALGQVASKFGTNVSNLAASSGAGQAQAFTTAGQNLANIFTSSAANIAGLESSLASTLAELELVRGKVGPFGKRGGGGIGTGAAMIAGAQIGANFGAPAAAAGAAGGFIADKLGII